MANKDFIIEANKIDLQEAINRGTSKTMLDRLALNEDRINGMANGLRELIALDDPIGEVIEMWKRPNGIEIGKKRVPMGVIGIIYEARPNVTCDAAGLCLKTGNAVVLKGGSDAINSNKAIVKILRSALKESSLPENSIQLVEDTSRETATKMMRLNEYIDDEFYSIEIRIYTNDELFTEINYPCNCVVMGTLDVPSCINSSIICFNDGKLILY